MKLICPICGKLYDYENKICKECEDYALRSQLASITPNLGDKWNCAIFLGEVNRIFGRRSIDNRRHVKPVEIFEFKIGQAVDYKWCIRQKGVSFEETEIPSEEFETIEALKLDEIEGFEKKLNLFLVYE